MKRNKLNLHPDPDPLSMPAGSTNTDFPLLPEGMYNVAIAGATKQPTKDREGAETLKVVVKTTKDTTSHDGKQPLPAGWPVSTYIGLTPTPERTLVNIAKDLALVLKSCGMRDTTPKQVIDSPSLIEGKVALVKISIQKEQDGFPPSNRVRFHEPKV